MVRARSSHLTTVLTAALLLMAASAIADEKEREAFLRKPVFQNNANSKTQKQSGAVAPRVVTPEEIARLNADREGLPSDDRSPSSDTLPVSPAPVPSGIAEVPPPVEATPTDAPVADAPKPSPFRSIGEIIFGLVILIFSGFIGVRSFRRKR